MPCHSPARSVAPSTCDGGARKVRKIDKELAKYQIEASKVDRDKKLEAIYDRFKNDPEAIESTYTMLLLEQRGAVVDDDTPFSCKCVTMWKVPNTFLVHWIPGISRLKESMLAEAAKKNPSALQEAMCRSLVIDPTDFFGPIDKSEWKLAMESRHAERGCKFDTWVLTDGRFDWDRCGLFMLHPARVRPERAHLHVHQVREPRGEDRQRPRRHRHCEDRLQLELEQSDLGAPRLQGREVALRRRFRRGGAVRRLDRAGVAAAHEEARREVDRPSRACSRQAYGSKVRFSASRHRLYTSGQDSFACQSSGEGRFV